MMNELWILPVMLLICLGLWRGYIGPVRTRFDVVGVLTLWFVFSAVVGLILLTVAVGEADAGNYHTFLPQVHGPARVYVLDCMDGTGQLIPCEALP